MIKNKPTAPTINTFLAMKQKGKRICMVTAYDFSMARSVAQAELDLILVGDSLGMVVLGYDNTLQVTIEDIIYHSSAVRRGAPTSFIIADMPYMSYHVGIKETKINASRLIIEGGANAVKLEGGTDSRIDAIKAIVDCEIPVCAHLGLTPQSIHVFGGYKVQGKSDADYDAIFRQALEVETAGAFMLVLEGIPELLGKEISANVKIPTIGIGAGRFTDGQVLVYQDLLGYGDGNFKFVKKYADLNTQIVQALRSYGEEVHNGEFPALEHVYYPIEQS